MSFVRLSCIIQIVIMGIHFVYMKHRFEATVKSFEVLLNNDLIVDNISVWYTEVSKDHRLINVEAVLRVPITNVQVRVEAFRVLRAKRIRLPFDFSGDGCLVLKSNSLIIPDLKNAGFPKECPVQAGPLHIHNLTLRRENLPSIVLTGSYAMKFTLYTNGKVFLIAEGAGVMKSIKESD